MNRFIRRCLIVAAVITGWYVAGFFPNLPAGTASVDETGDAVADGTTHGGEAERGQPAAAALAPKAGTVAWFRPVVTGIFGLFVAAIVVGIPVQKLRGTEPPDVGH